MRAVIQRVSEAAVHVDESVVGEIGTGLVVLLGVGKGDSPRHCAWLAEKVTQIRIFPDDSGKMREPLDTGRGSILVVSQFTLYGSVVHGRRPDFGEAAGKALAEQLYEDFIERCRAAGYRVETGQFGAHMELSLVNVGPVTIVIDTDEVIEGGE